MHPTNQAVNIYPFEFSTRRAHQWVLVTRMGTRSGCSEPRTRTATDAQTGTENFFIIMDDVVEVNLVVPFHLFNNIAENVK